MVSGVGLDLLKIRRRVRVYFDPPKMSHSFAIRPIIPSNGNPTGKLLVRSTGIPAGRVGSGRVVSGFRHGSGTGRGKHHRVRGAGRIVEMLAPHIPGCDLYCIADAT